MTDAQRSAMVAARYYGKRAGDGWTHWAILGDKAVLDSLVESGHLEHRTIYGTTKRPVEQYRIRPKETTHGD